MAGRSTSLKKTYLELNDALLGALKAFGRELKDPLMAACCLGAVLLIAMFIALVYGTALDVEAEREAARLAALEPPKTITISNAIVDLGKQQVTFTVKDIPKGYETQVSCPIEEVIN